MAVLDRQKLVVLVKHAELEALIDEYAYAAMALDVSGRVAQQESSTWQRDFPLPL